MMKSLPCFPLSLKILLTFPILSILACSTIQAEETLPEPPEGTFSIVVIPDTQSYQRSSSISDDDTLENPIFSRHIDWITENLSKHNVAFVSHVGDIVDKNVPQQWECAQRCMNRLHGKVPYGISVGNHDMTADGDSSLFQQMFPAKRFETMSWYGGSYQPVEAQAGHSTNNANSFQLFTAEDIDFVFLHLECNAPDDVLAWADQILKRYADRKAIVTSHMGLGPLVKPTSNEGYVDSPKGRMRWKKIHGDAGNSPDQMWEKCFRKHPNLILVCCGDQSRTQSMHLASVGDHGNTVYQVLSDYSTGWLRLYRFHPQENRIEAWTFDPTSEQLCTSAEYAQARSLNQFSFSVPLFEATLTNRDN
ncbi:metallophosphoesterase [Bremerella sp. JC770]|uniref:metallophosphoesterase n=1 Tax=Bremerella sp. JC770 TaxID=3232137 RepID=UPI00345806A6